MRFCWVIALLCPVLSVAGPYVTSTFSDSYLNESAKGDQLVLQFNPYIPKLTALYYRKKKMSVIRWKAKASKSITRKYLFTDKRSYVSKIVVSVDSKRNKGSILIWHKKRKGFTVIKRHKSQLIIRTRKEKEEGSPVRAVATVKKDRITKPVIALISLNVRKSPVEKVLRTIASAAGRSIIFGDDIKGNITVSIRDLPYEEAIKMVMRATSYRASHKGMVTVVTTAERSRSFRILRWQHVDVSAVEQTMKDLIGDGELSIDKATNSMFIIARHSVLERVVQMRKELDKPPKQVEVEAAIIEIDHSDSRDIGFDLQGSMLSSGINANIRSTVSPFDANSTGSKGFYVGLSWRSVTGILGLLRSKGDITVIARPRIVALNDEEAEILIGSRLGYKTITVTQNGNVENVEFLTVGTKLKIKPHITRSGKVLMELRPEVSDGSVDATTGLPSETTTSSRTKVLAGDGQTVVMGGLLRDRTQRVVDKVPILGDIPLLGFFFRGTRESVVKKEMMIMLAPKVITYRVVASYKEEGVRMLRRAYEERSQMQSPPARYSNND